MTFNGRSCKKDTKKRYGVGESAQMELLSVGTKMIRLPDPLSSTLHSFLIVLPLLVVGDAVVVVVVVDDAR